MVSIAPTVPAGAAISFALGDSIAVGINMVVNPSLNNASNDTSRLSGNVIAHVGAGCSTVLNSIRVLVANAPNALNGKVVALSSGASNSPMATELNKTFDQIDAVLKAGGLPVVIGVSKTYSLFGSRGDEMNIALEHLATVQGVPFAGGFAAGPDNIHPASYAALVQQIRTALNIFHPVPAPPPLAQPENGGVAGGPVLQDNGPTLPDGVPQITGLAREDAQAILASIFSAGGRATMVETPAGSGVFAIFQTGAAVTKPGAGEDGTTSTNPKTASGLDRKIFFDNIRARIFRGTLRQSQVDGISAILDGWDKLLPTGDPRWLAYMFATVFWETAQTMQPIEEIGHGQGHDYGLPTRPFGHIYYGRGFVQLTHAENYKNATINLRGHGVIGNDIDLLRDPQLAMRMDIATAILFFGMTEGWFRPPNKLSLFFVTGKEDWLHARDIINGGLDHATDIANFGHAFHAAILASFQR